MGTDSIGVSESEIQSLHERLNSEAEQGGYHLNPDVEFTKDLVRGLITNEKRYGYMACPCRLASRTKVADLDIICPCDYRDPDLGEYDMCYCALYVSGPVSKGQKELRGSIPERRPSGKDRKRPRSKSASSGMPSLHLPVWRCKVCGYLCARDEPPEACPICKAKKDRFAEFI